jgi:mono/diheme cytochrome c family protein
MLSTQRLDQRTSGTTGNRTVPVLFSLSAILIVAFWILWLSSYVLHRAYVLGESSAAGSGYLESWWAWLALAGIGWGCLNLYWSMSALRLANLRLFLGHWLIATACGMIVVGTEAVMIARALTIAPIIVDHSGRDSRASQGSGAAKPSVTVAGDAEKGKAIFSKTCVTCHGPTGQGMPNLAPSLVGSAFIKSAEDSAVASVIGLGRALGDPGNKSGKVMPARGGNPFLTDEDIIHLVAFVKAIQSTSNASAEPSPEGTPALQLANWVVPTAEPAATTIDIRQADQEMVGGLSRLDFTAQQRSQLKRWLTIGLSTVHGFFLLGVVAVSGSVVLPRMISSGGNINARYIKLSVIGWVLSAASWLLIAWLCFWWR